MHNPKNQREFVQKIVCKDKVKHIVSRKNGLVVHLIDEESAICSHPPTLKICARVIKTEHAGIIKMDPDYDVSQIPGLDSSVVSAKRYGSSRIVQLNFKLKKSLISQSSLASRLNIAYSE